MSSQFADTVVFRAAERRFDVDGKPFPYHMSVAGPKFNRLAEKWSVSVALFPTLLADTGEFVELDAVVEDGPGPRLLPRLLIGGQPFPWTITDAGVCIRAGRTRVTVIELAFLARSVDTDSAYVDERPLGAA